MNFVILVKRRELDIVVISDTNTEKGQAKETTRRGSMNVIE